MSVYLIPPGGQLPELMEVLSKAKVQFHAFTRLREFLLVDHASPVVVGTLDATGLLVLNRYASSLVDELPTVVMSVPGAAYTGEWMSLASAFPALDWIELRNKLAKSGHLALDPDQLESRGVGTKQEGTDIIGRVQAVRHPMAGTSSLGLGVTHSRARQRPRDEEEDETANDQVDS